MFVWVCIIRVIVIELYLVFGSKTRTNERTYFGWIEKIQNVWNSTFRNNERNFPHVLMCGKCIERWFLLHLRKNIYTFYDL